MKVLVLDDDAMIASALGLLLNDEGHDATVCTSGKMALQALERERFSAVLTDIEMPPPDGCSLVRFARALHDSPCVVVVTGIESMERLRAVQEIGPCSVFQKPANYDRVLAALHPAGQCSLCGVGRQRSSVRMRDAH